MSACVCLTIACVLYSTVFVQYMMSSLALVVISVIDAHGNC